MTEPQFFARPKGLTAQEIATLTGAVAREGAAFDRSITGLATLDRAGPSDIAFLLPFLRNAGAVFLDADHSPRPSSMPCASTCETSEVDRLFADLASGASASGSFIQRRAERPGSEWDEWFNPWEK